MQAGGSEPGPVPCPGATWRRAWSSLGPQGWGCYGHVVGHLQCTGQTPSKGCAPRVDREEVEECWGTHWQVRETSAGTSRGYPLPMAQLLSRRSQRHPTPKGDSERVP